MNIFIIAVTEATPKENPLIYYAIMIIISILIGGLMVFFSVVKKAKESRLNDINARFQDKERLFFSKSANFLGYKSKNYQQVKGNGYLVLTKDEIYFLMWLPPTEVKIPIRDIISIDTPKSFLGKKSRKLLKIIFTANDKHTSGTTTEEVAWSISKLDKVKSILEKLIEK